MKYKRGDIVWVKFPFSDSASFKIRPALIISNPLINQTGDYLLMQITSRIRGDTLSIIIADEYFEDSPLKLKSELRVHKIFILNEKLIEGKITSLHEKFMDLVVDKLHSLIK